MNTTIRGALSVLGLTGEMVTKDLIKTTYRRLAAQYHPDRNPQGALMMQQINVAYQYLCENFDGEVTKDHSDIFTFRGMVIYRDRLKTVVSGQTYNFKKTLKDCGFRWNPDKKVWWRHGAYPIEEDLYAA